MVCPDGADGWVGTQLSVGSGFGDPADPQKAWVLMAEKLQLPASRQDPCTLL